MRAALLALPFCLSALTAQTFPSYESPQVHPVDISADGSRLLVCSTVDQRVAWFSLADPRRPALLRSIVVGVEPVTARFRTPNEAWVLNHIGDSISIVDLDAGVVIDTVAVGDEPSGLVFAGGRAFVTLPTERRVAVLDPVTRAEVGSIDLFCDEPRWVTANHDGSLLYVAAHKSGNETTVVPEHLAPPQPPPTNPALPAPPSTSLIVDSEDPTWTAAHGVDLPDHDVFEIDTATLAVTRRFSGVGTILFGLAVRGVDGAVWVANTEARNLIRFEANVRGHMVDNRVTEITTGASPTVTPYDLNPTVDYTVLPNPAALSTALAQPTDVVFSPDDSRAFVTAFGTDRIGVLDPSNGQVVARVEIGETPGTLVNSRRKRGPRGLVHSPTEPLLYVVNRLSNSLSVVDTVAQQEVLEVQLFDPTPVDLREGRGFHYDAKLSGNGTQSCASCHIDMTTDNLAWDLGNRGGDMVTVGGRAGPEVLHPMKGPLLTQSMQGLLALRGLHWRGDRADLAAFNSAFDSLMGGPQVSSADMASFAAFANTVRYAGNPHQNLDRTYDATPVGSSAEEGRVAFSLLPSLGGFRCGRCHIPFSGTESSVINAVTLQAPQGMRVAQLRNIYKRTPAKNLSGERTAGYGLLHDGADDDVFEFLSKPVFGAISTDAAVKAQLQSFVEAFDTGTAPIVGYGRTIDASNHTDPVVVADRDLLFARALARDCDLIVLGVVDGRDEGFYLDRLTQTFLRDRAGAPALTLAQLDQLIGQGQATLTFTAAPQGEGYRMAINRDGNATPDGDQASVAYGAGTPGCGLSLRANSIPRLGSRVFGLVAEGAPAVGQGAVFVGTGAAVVPILGVEVLVEPATITSLPFTTDSVGTAVAALPIPASAALSGLQFYAQAVAFDACGSFGLAASGGVQFRLR